MEMSSYYKDDVTISANTNGTITFSLSENEAWKIKRIELGGIPNDADVSITYLDDRSQYVSLPSVPAVKFPMVFKKTATDRPFTLTSNSNIKITITNPLPVEIHAYAYIFYDKVLISKGE